MVSKGKRDKFVFNQIGIIHSPYKTQGETPIQSFLSEETGEIEVFKEYEDGLKDLEGFSHIMVLYVFHKFKDFSLHVKPYLDNRLRGVFATRAPKRPNPIGLSIVRLLERQGNRLKIKNIDMLDGTPLLDIKPCVHVYDNRQDVRSGWLESRLKDKN